jgi:hypothetical protein
MGLDLYSEIFVKKALLYETRTIRIDAQDLRNSGDYGGLNTVSIEQATEQIINAQEFLALAENHMGTLLP